MFLKNLKFETKSVPQKGTLFYYKVLCINARRALIFS